MYRTNPRRRMRFALLSAATVAVILTATACSGSGDTQGGNVSSSSSFPTKGSGELNLFNFTNYINPDTLAKFTKETGIKVNVDTFSSAEEMVAKVKTGTATYDVVTTSDYVTQDLISSGQLLEVDATTWPNGGNIEKDFVDIYFDKGRKYTTPYATVYNGIGYNPKAVKGPVGTWKDYFSVPAGSAGKIGLHDSQTFVIDAALLATGSKPCTTTGSDYQKALELLQKFKPSIKVISSDGTIDRLAGGETVLSTMWNGSFARAQAQNHDLKYVLPSDGYAVSTDNLAILKNAKNADNAKIFMNWMLNPINAATNANWIKYSVPLTGLDTELAKLDAGGAPVIIPTAEQAKNGIIQEPCPADVKAQYDKLWTMFKG
ncbi:PotD/PotF family extracellular solute-binding protein [Arthrobacter sp. NPDC090010]|uniref:ABC transporter substrate-binding protein n=1 Tax=Arthrobacter sp. NPDC090010 TaxID=3363942 RepID=UPI00381CF9D8